MMDLSPLFGNAPLKALLSAQSGRGLGHAYLLAGPPLSGRHTLAALLAAAFLCASPPEDRPCRRCLSCRKVEKGIHPDLLYIRGAGAKAISVDQIRALRADAYIRPNEAARKVYVLEDAQEMRPPAQNAMLKLLEEAPPYAAFLLLTDDPSALLQTVRSRCQTLTLSPLTQAETLEALKVRFPQKPLSALTRAAAECQGILGRAVAALETEEGSLPAQQAPRLLALIAGGEELALLEFTLTLESWSREDLSALFSQTAALLADALALRQEGSGRRPDLPRPLPAVTAAASLPPRQILQLIRLLHQLQEWIPFYVHPTHLAGRLCAAVSQIRQP